MRELKEILINDIQYIKTGETILPKYVKDLNDNWVGKINIENMLYADEGYEETIAIAEVIQYLISNEYKAVNEKEYNKNHYSVLLKEIDEKIYNNNREIKDLQEENQNLKKEKLKLLGYLKGEKI